jgi:dTDP-glucose pyrophosphorylase
MMAGRAVPDHDAEEIDQFRRLLGDGWQHRASFAIQDHPGGIAEAFLIMRFWPAACRF